MREYVAFAKLPEGERAIGARVRAARREFKLSQEKLAPLIGLSRDQLNSIELGRVALRFRPGWNLCLELDLNPAWLLSGQGDRQGFVDPGMEYVGVDELFSSVMEELVSEDLGSPDGWPGYAKYRLLRLGSRKAVLHPDDALADWLKQVRPELHADFLKFIHRSARDFIRQQYKDVTNLLTGRSELGRLGSMNLQNASLWPALRQRVLRVVRPRGMKSVLARDIGVTRQAINALLSRTGTHGPSAEYTLRLSKWVEIAEAQQKQGAGVSAPARKTRERQNYERKPSSNRKKK